MSQNAVSNTLLYPAQVIGLAAIYVVSAKLSLALAIPPGYATPIWPPAGIALAALLFFGRRAWPGIWLGAAAVNYAVESSLVSAFTIGVGNSLEGVVAALLVERRQSDPRDFRRAEDVVSFIVICVIAASVAASVASVALALNNSLPWALAFRNWWTWWQGDLAGMIIVAPLLLSWSIPSPSPWPAAKKLEAATFAVLLGGTAWAVTMNEAARYAPFSLTFIALPFILWAAIRFGQREVTTTIAVVCAVAVWFVLERPALFEPTPVNELLLLLLSFNSMVVTTGLVVVTALRQRERQALSAARNDALTGLANAALFDEQLARLLAVSRVQKAKVVLALMDIERFKTVNDTLGRHVGDNALRQIADRVSIGLTPDTLIARVSGDRFALAAAYSETGLGKVMPSRLSKWFGPAYLVDGHELRLSARVGVALFPDDAQDADSLFLRAESALKKAKASGERLLFFTQSMTERMAEKLSLENQLRRAVEREEFVLHYQPKIDLDTRALVGLEALIRWNSPERGLVPPARFIPMLEESGLILEVGSWAFRRAMLDQALWASEGVPLPRVAVNVSSIQLRQPNFVEMVQQAVGPGADPRLVELEITESRIMEDIDANIAKLKRIRDLGIRVAIDDFGTGYSSLAYLARLPVQTLKIDREFIATMLSDDETMAVVQTVISLAQSLKLTTVAEGVEREEQADVLELLRCDQIQGYFVSRPKPREEITPLLRERPRS